MAKVTLLSSAEGGKQQPTPAGVPFRCVIRSGKHAFDCRLVLAEGQALYPGGTYIVPVQFLNPQVARQYINYDTELELWSGGVIGLFTLLKTK